MSNKVDIPINLDNLRSIVKDLMERQELKSALFLADKIVDLSNSSNCNNIDDDVLTLGQCLYRLKEYHRAIHCIKERKLHEKSLAARHLVAKCHYSASEFKEAFEVITFGECPSNVTSNGQNNTKVTMTANDVTLAEDDVFCSIKDMKWKSSLYLLKGKIYESLDNRSIAAINYKKSLKCDLFNYESFECLTRHQMLTRHEEEEIINKLTVTNQEDELIKFMYSNLLKKYSKPHIDSQDIVVNVSTTTSTSKSVQTESSAKDGHHTHQTRSTRCDKRAKEVVIKDEAMNTEEDQSSSTLKNEMHQRLLATNVDMMTSKAESLYYNCDYVNCYNLTSQVLKKDIYHPSCLPVHISTLIELKKIIELFELAHNLVTLYPENAISWYAVGCYYLMINKTESARRFLNKSTTLDPVFGPAWLLYGHSFAIESEHDQAMAAYFKASHLMKGCHLPLLYIGLEYGLTDNVKLAEKFFQQSLIIAPNDPFVLHELSVIHFQSHDYSKAETYSLKALNIIKNSKNNLTTTRRVHVPEKWESLLNNLGHIKRKLRKFDESLEYHRQAMVLSPQNASTYSAIGFVLMFQSKWSEAVEYFHKSLGLKRDDPFATNCLTTCLEQLTNQVAKEVTSFASNEDEVLIKKFVERKNKRNVMTMASTSTTDDVKTEDVEMS